MKVTTILFLVISTSNIVQNAVSAKNVPTFTINRQATVRFPLEQGNTDKKNDTKPEKFLIDSPLETSKNATNDWTTTTIRPTKSTTKSNSVQVIGNYSIAVQHASKVKTESGAEEIIEQKSSLLEVLNFLRQLPREKLAEIYFGAEGIENSSASTTESVLEFLNDLREQQRTSTTTTTTTTTSTTTKTPDIALDITSTTISISSTTVTTTISTTTSKIEEIAILIEDDEENDATEQSVLEPDTVPEMETEELALVPEDVIEIENDKDNTTDTSVSPSSPLPQPPPPLIVATTENFTTVFSTTSTTTTTTSTTSLISSYEYTDYPPPLPPPLSDYPNLINRDQKTDTSFAVGVAVGILACVVVLGGGATWCVCRRTCSFSTRNVYATMEAEEIPRAFTKPGPPVILPEEFDQIGKTSNGLIRKASFYKGEIEANRVTEL